MSRMTDDERAIEARGLSMAEIQLAAHQLGMYLAHKRGDMSAWREQNRAASELRERVLTYQPYPYTNPSLVRSMMQALRCGGITRVEWAACMAAAITGAHRRDP